MKKIFLIILIIASAQVFGEKLPADKARGLFVAIGVGPRLPALEFSSSSFLGYGFEVELSYTDNSYLPVFLFGKIGYCQFPGSQDLYQRTDYSNFSTAMIPFAVGVRYYLPPVLENIVLIIPNVEMSLLFGLYERLHQFKAGSLKSNFIEDGSKFGLSFGAGASMFLLEVNGAYNYFLHNQYLSFDIKVRLPLFISI